MVSTSIGFPHGPFGLATGPPATAKSAAPVSQPTDALAVTFEAGSRRLGAVEASVVRDWAQRSLARDPEGVVIMGCTAAAGRRGRIARLRILHGLIARSGVAQARIRFTGNAIGAPDIAYSGGAVTASCRATLRVISGRQAEREVRSIRSLLEVAGSRREARCTSAS